MKIVVDYDGTLVTLVNFPNGNKPIVDVINGLKKLQKQGHEIIIVTARRKNSPSGYKDITDFVDKYGLNVKTIWLEAKQRAFVYLDDHAVNPQDKDWLKKANWLLNSYGKKIIKYYGKERMNLEWVPENTVKIVKRGKKWIMKKQQDI